MSLHDEFEAAQQRVNTLSATPGADQLLALYGLYKQANVGDVQGKRPGMLDINGRAKYDAWAKNKALSKDDAMRQYIALVDSLVGK